MITIDALHVRDSPDAWRALGFDVVDGACHVGTVRIRLTDDGAGIAGWSLRDVPADLTDVDGIPTASSTGARPDAGLHPNGVTRIDHLVLMTPDLPRTVGALEALGLDMRRERDAGAFKQVFFRLGEVILELVGPHEPGPGEAALWGLTFAVSDLDATADSLGERIGRVKDAVQPGRRIATLRGKDIGISPAVAFMSEAGQAS